uniref:hypothetical protein n=1 Tax=Corallococcus coralloides TaxID=184914 RepID=UPI000FFEF6D6|nr:hypothetical protein [Corallococcus coralloides]
MTKPASFILRFQEPVPSEKLLHASSDLMTKTGDGAREQGDTEFHATAFGTTTFTRSRENQDQDLERAGHSLFTQTRDSQLALRDTQTITEAREQLDYDNSSHENTVFRGALASDVIRMGTHTRTDNETRESADQDFASIGSTFLDATKA